MLGHQLRQDFILGLDLLLQILDAFLLGWLAQLAFGFKCGRAVFEKLLLPAIEHRGFQAQIIAQLRNPRPVQQMPSQNGNLLFSGVVLSFFLHAFSVS